MDRRAISSSWLNLLASKYSEITRACSRSKSLSTLEMTSRPGRPHLETTETGNRLCQRRPVIDQSQHWQLRFGCEGQPERLEFGSYLFIQRLRLRLPPSPPTPQSLACPHRLAEPHGLLLASWSPLRTSVVTAVPTWMPTGIARSRKDAGVWRAVRESTLPVLYLSPFRLSTRIDVELLAGNAPSYL